jgi:succinate-semialdehyde dehydrogenase/glutarate-semialdehyde dehydrogenase
LKEPIGPVAAFSPWNFPLLQAVRKVAAALGAGCSIVLKPAEETPGCCAELCGIFQGVGLPDGVLNMLLGIPSQISSGLIAHCEIRKVSFTGSVSIGRTIAALAGQHLKKTTLELGGHAPFIVFGDVDPQRVAQLAATMKFRNAGQVCASPTRFLVEDGVSETFIAAFNAAAKALKLGAGLAAETQMGPLANERRVSAIESIVTAAIGAGGSRICGGERVGNRGYFYSPTIIVGAPPNCDLNIREPFGPVASVITFRSAEEAWHLANSVPYALSSYVFTNDLGIAHEASTNIDTGTVSLNHWGLGAPENPFGGRKDSGHGSEGGIEGLDAYMTTKFVTQLCKSP